PSCQPSCCPPGVVAPGVAVRLRPRCRYARGASCRSRPLLDRAAPELTSLASPFAASRVQPQTASAAVARWDFLDILRSPNCVNDRCYAFDRRLRYSREKTACTDK